MAGIERRGEKVSYMFSAVIFLTIQYVCLPTVSEIISIYGGSAGVFQSRNQFS
jgi:hypothetical protein